MLYRLLADALVVIHGGFVVFVVLGALLVLRWRRVLWLHLPAVLWGAWIEFSGWICPLTPWEQALRHRAGQAGYAGGFMEHYLIPLIYPPGLSPHTQKLLGLVVVVMNLALYSVVWQRRRAKE